VASEPKLEGSPKRPDVEAATRRPESCASGFLSLNRSEEQSLVLCHCLPSETDPRRSATLGSPQAGQTFQRWLGQLVSRGHLPKQGRVETVSAVTAEAGRVGTFPRVRGLRQVEAPVRLWFQRRTSSAFRSPEGSHKCEGQAALPIAAGAWEARRATGYV
jgi:hypothetical protein